MAARCPDAAASAAPTEPSHAEVAPTEAAAAEAGSADAVGSDLLPSRGLANAVVALRSPNFARFWTGALVSNCGTWMQHVTVPYVLYQQTRSAALLGVAGFAQFFPAMVLGPVGGWAADHYPRRSVLLVTQSLMGALAALLWALYVADLAPAWVLITMVFLGGVVAGVNIPSWQSFVAELVPRERLLNAVTLNSAQFNAARAVGPALGGAVLARYGPSWAFLANALSYAAVLVALVGVRVDHVVHNQRRDRRVMSQFRESLDYTRRHRGMLLAVCLVAAVAFLVNPFVQLVPVFADEVFGVGAAAYGLLAATFGGGAVIGAIVLGSFGSVTRRGRLVGAAMVVNGFAVAGFGAVSNVVPAAVTMAIAGAAMLVTVANLNTSVQLLVPEALRGRLMALYIMTFTGAYPVGALAQGALADIVGPRATVIGAAAVFLVITGVTALTPGLLSSLDEHWHRDRGRGRGRDRDRDRDGHRNQPGDTATAAGPTPTVGEVTFR